MNILYKTWAHIWADLQVTALLVFNGIYGCSTNKYSHLCIHICICSYSSVHTCISKYMYTYRNNYLFMWSSVESKYYTVFFFMHSANVVRPSCELIVILQKHSKGWGLKEMQKISNNKNCIFMNKLQTTTTTTKTNRLWRMYIFQQYIVIVL